ncbi:hypothetical protein P5673_000719 [Acropora cervicornis]|uniref:Uncharacterized protein n=1 Tax=Acropora cervicornis TaxID=6130 RepID=A0AAD9R7F5_ACRCE|nr:hypothetical protein P5673_000719 [Acropora cervicornis]
MEMTALQQIQGFHVLQSWKLLKESRKDNSHPKRSRDPCMMLMFHETRGTLRATQTAYRSRRETGSTLHDPRITFRDSR